MPLFPMQKFALGQIVMTASIHHLCQLDPNSPALLQKQLEMFAAGNWGNCGEHDWQVNEQALVNNTRLMGVYDIQLDPQTTELTRIWIITEADRSVTTILLPKDY